MPRSREPPSQRQKSRRKSPGKPRTRCRKHKNPKDTKTHSSPLNTLSKIPELSEILGNKNELLGNIDKLSQLESSDLKQKIEKIDYKIRKNKDSSKSMELNRERISLLTAYMAKNL